MFVALVCLLSLGCVQSFAPVFQAASFFDSVQAIFAPNAKSGEAGGTNAAKREELKEALLDECRSDSGGNMKAKRARVENIINELAPLSPIVDTASSPELQKEWLMAFTTEKEINFFIVVGLTSRSGVSQTIDGKDLGNLIEFKRGGGLSVSGELSVAETEGDGEPKLRTNFVFTEANLDLGRWGSFKLPPVGEGWFETLYLDNTLRVDINSRDDILICTPK
jgi:hypothetical protein